MDPVSVKVVPSTLCGTLTGQHSEHRHRHRHCHRHRHRNRYCHRYIDNNTNPPPVILAVKDQSQPGAKLIFNHASGSAKWRVRVSSLYRLSSRLS